MKETVNILGVPYNVTESDDSLNTNEDGFCNPSAQQIYVRKGICPQRQAQVFLHEVIHAILAQLNRDEEYNNEQLIQGLAIGLQMALFPNGLKSNEWHNFSKEPPPKGKPILCVEDGIYYVGRLEVEPDGTPTDTVWVVAARGGEYRHPEEWMEFDEAEYKQKEGEPNGD